MYHITVLLFTAPEQVLCNWGEGRDNRTFIGESLRELATTIFYRNWIKKSKYCKGEDYSMEQEYKYISTPKSESTPAPETSKPAPTTETNVAKALRVMGNTETVQGTTRQIVDAGILGTCVAFFIAFLAIQPKDVDVPLSRAIIFLGIAVPLIGWGYLQSTLKAKPGPGWLILQALLIGSAVGEAIGEVVAAVGFLFLLLHFSSWAFWASLLAASGVLLAIPLLSFIGLFVYAWWASRSEERMKRLADLAAAPSSEAKQKQDEAEPSKS